MQAVILVGGEGTRLRPLTSGTPKPIVTFVDRPFMGFMLGWLARHGVTDVVMCCGFLATKVKDVLGDGSAFGVQLRFVEEPEPRGTAGALKFAEALLEDRFLMLNGDTLTDIDLSAQIAQHERTGAVGTLCLVPVEDPSAFGLVLRHEDTSVSGFLEKPGPDQLVGLDRYLVSGGIYVLERTVLDLIAPDQNVSIETQIWPALVGQGLYGFAADASSYWLDIGTPDRYLQGTADILTGAVETAVSQRLDGSRQAIAGDVHPGARVTGPVIIEAGATVAAGATVKGPAIIGAGTTVAADATVDGAVILADCTIGAGAIVRGAILSPNVTVGERTVVSDLAMLGDGVSVGADNVLGAAVKLFPGTALGDGAIKV
ncbi:MAG: NDP-sugar synthase [Solirubrobacterales bacterium]|nr:NDP-sugar synthase [Solirubrobacterales bacterium]